MPRVVNLPVMGGRAGHHLVAEWNIAGAGGRSSGHGRGPALKREVVNNLAGHCLGAAHETSRRMGEHANEEREQTETTGRRTEQRRRPGSEGGDRDDGSSAEEPKDDMVLCLLLSTISLHSF